MGPALIRLRTWGVTTQPLAAAAADSSLSRVFVASHRLSVGEQGCAVCERLLAAGLLQCPGSGAQLQQLGHMGLAALWHVKSFWSKDQTRVPHLGRWTLNDCTIREVLPCSFLN